MPVDRYQPKRHAPKPFWVIWWLGGLALLAYALSFARPIAFVFGLFLTIACWLVNWTLTSAGPNVRIPPNEPTETAPAGVALRQVPAHLLDGPECNSGPLR